VHEASFARCHTLLSGRLAQERVAARGRASCFGTPIPSAPSDPPVRTVWVTRPLHRLALSSEDLMLEERREGSFGGGWRRLVG
jgi:hypothetical protein